MQPPAQDYLDVLNTRFSGVIRGGSHPPKSGRACALEIAHAVVGDPWSDQPDKWPDIRPINDGLWENAKTRTEALVPVMMMYWEWAEWPDTRRFTVMRMIALKTVQQILADLPGLDNTISAGCRRVQTLSEAAFATAQTIVALTRPVETEEEAAMAIARKLMAVDTEMRAEGGEHTVGRA